MKSLRDILSVLVVLLLGLGYFASQSFALNGRAVEWAQKVDQPPVARLALVLLLIAVGLAFARQREVGC